MAEGPAPGSGRGEDPAGRGTPDGTRGRHLWQWPPARRARRLARGFAPGQLLDQARPGPGADPAAE